MKRLIFKHKNTCGLIFLKELWEILRSVKGARIGFFKTFIFKQHVAKTNPLFPNGKYSKTKKKKENGFFPQIMDSSTSISYFFFFLKNVFYLEFERCSGYLGPAAALRGLLCCNRCTSGCNGSETNDYSICILEDL